MNKKFEIVAFYDEDAYSQDKFRLNFIEYGIVIGFVQFYNCLNYREYFDNDLSDNQYYNLFPEDKFIMIDMVHIISDFRGSGYATQMMNYFMDYIKIHGIYDKLFLNASPSDSFSDNNYLPLNILILFYKKFGFEIVPNTKTKYNCYMIQTLN